jgi:DNA-binding FadR family transcriptional regulator
MSRPKSDFIPLAAPKLRKQSLREQVVKVLKRHIVETGLLPGAKLPPERDLSQGLAVSRTVVREALAALEAEGWLDHEPSTGYFVTPAAGTSPADTAEEAQRLLLENLEARLAIEMGVAEVLVQQITDADLDELEAQARALDEAMLQNEANAEAELAFHLRVWAATQNPVLLTVGQQILGDYFRALALALPADFYRPMQAADARRHLPLVQALRTRDLPLVQAAFREHGQLTQALRIQAQTLEKTAVDKPFVNGASAQLQ